MCRKRPIQVPWIVSCPSVRLRSLREELRELSGLEPWCLGARMLLARLCSGVPSTPARRKQMKAHAWTPGLPVSQCSKRIFLSFPGRTGAAPASDEQRGRDGGIFQPFLSLSCFHTFCTQNSARLPKTRSPSRRWVPKTESSTRVSASLCLSLSLSLSLSALDEPQPRAYILQV